MKYVFKKLAYTLAMTVIDTFGSLVFFPLKLFSKHAPLEPKSILIVRLDHIGDFVCTTPIFKNIKERFPGAAITALINSVSKDLAAKNPYIDKVITFSPLYLARSEKTSAFKGLMRVIKDVKNIRFDLGIDPRGDLISILIMWWGGVKYRIGYGITGGGFLLNKMCRYDESKHVIDRNSALLEALNIPVSNRSPEVHFGDEDIEVVERLLREKGVRPNQRAVDALGQTPFPSSVVLHPFAGAKAKEWFRLNFQELIGCLASLGKKVILVGSQVDDGIFTNVIDMRGRLSLPQLAYLIKVVDFFIGLDSGPANIAAALNVPSVIICSGTNLPELWIPDNPNVKFIYKDTGCKPCGLKVCIKEKHECMSSITVDEIMNAVREVLK